MTEKHQIQNIGKAPLTVSDVEQQLADDVFANRGRGASDVWALAQAVAVREVALREYYEGLLRDLHERVFKLEGSPTEGAAEAVRQESDK